jgi:hypothetical protein
MGTANPNEVGTTGGAATHVHTGTTDPNAELHGITDNPYLGLKGDAHAHTHSFTTQPASNIPPYVKLVFIMKQ